MLDHLRIDHEKSQLVGRAPVEQREQHDVQADALAGTGRPRDDDVRHAREVRVDRVAEDVAAQHHGQRHVQRLEPTILDQVAQDHLDASLVRQLEADAVLAGDRGDDAHLACEGEREIVRQPRYFRHLGSRRGRDFVRRHRRPRQDVLDFALHPIVRQRLNELVCVREKLVAVDGEARIGLFGDKKVHARQLEGRRAEPAVARRGGLFRKRGRCVDDRRRLFRAPGFARKGLGRGRNGLRLDLFARRAVRRTRGERIERRGRVGGQRLGDALIDFERQRGDNRVVLRGRIDARLARDALDFPALQLESASLPPGFAHGATGGRRPPPHPGREGRDQPGECDERERGAPDEDEPQACESDEETSGRGKE
jgi:hypothetical protein